MVYHSRTLPGIPKTETMKARILTHKSGKYQIKVKNWWWPFWVTMKNGTSGVTLFDDEEEAERWVYFKFSNKKHHRPIVMREFKF